MGPKDTRALLHALEYARVCEARIADGFALPGSKVFHMGILWRLIKLASAAGGPAHEALELHERWLKDEIDDEGRPV